MAHHRRHLPRTRTPGNPYSMSSWPAWHDIVNHRRPHRRRANRLARSVLLGRDPEGIAWPVPKKPHIYYW